MKELSGRVEFHAKLATRGRVYIPKVIVERWTLWRDTPIHVRVLLRGQLRSVEFDTRVRSGFCFVIPQNELRVLQAERGAMLRVDVSRVDVQRPNSTSASSWQDRSFLEGGAFCRIFD